MGLFTVTELWEVVREAGVWRVGRRYYYLSGCEALGSGSKAPEGGDCDMSIVDMEYVKGKLFKCGQYQLNYLYKL